jgi:DNA-binding PadR family transcriptional regulator
MDGVESITRGWWRPTAGSIYPLLKEMTDQGIVKRLDDGRYELTGKGRIQVEGTFGRHHQRPRTMDDMVGQMQAFVSYMEDVKGTGSGNLEPHLGRLKGLAKRLSDLAGDDSEEEKTDS